MEFIKQNNTYFILCEIKTQKSTNKESLEKIQNINNFFCYEELDEGIYQIFLLPLFIIDKIKQQTNIGQTTLIPYQAAIKNIIVNNSGNNETILFLHQVDNKTLIMTGIKGKEVSQATSIPIQNLKETVKTSINDFKTIFRVHNLLVATNNKGIAEQLEEIDIKVFPFPHTLPIRNIPEFILPQHIEFEKTEADKKQLHLVGGAIVFGLLLAGTIFYQNRTVLNQLKTQRDLLQKQVEAKQVLFTKYQQQNIEKHFSSQDKNKVVSVISKFSQLPPGYSFKTLLIKQMPAGNYQTDIFVSVAAPGMSLNPIQKLFSKGIINPVFNNDEQIYKIEYVF